MTTNFSPREFEENEDVIASEKTMIEVPDTGYGVHKSQEGVEELVSAIRAAAVACTE